MPQEVARVLVFGWQQADERRGWTSPSTSTRRMWREAAWKVQRSIAGGKWVGKLWQKMTQPQR